MKLIADVEKLVSSLHAAVAGSETEHQHDVDRMHVCVITVLWHSFLILTVNDDSDDICNTKTL